jgi:prepilin-type N-terminal cleavage/methylation domain-containing protein
MKTHNRNDKSSSKSAGFTLIELLVVVAIIGVLTAIAIVSVQRAIKKANISAVAAESKTVYEAFTVYMMDNNNYPYATSNPSFQLDTFEPLRSMGYYRGNITTKLANSRADAYDSPDDNGLNNEFWLLVTVESDPSVQFLICNSDDTPLAANEWLDGIYMYQNGQLTKIEDYES